MHTVHGVSECETVMEHGWKNRSVGATLMNADSSRSHSIFTIHVEQMDKGEAVEMALLRFINRPRTRFHNCANCVAFRQ